jgi:DNA-binding CsgD family transcriptional regulator
MFKAAPVDATDPPDGGLTRNERCLLEWLAAGRTNAQIARCANRSEKTVSNQLTRVYAKLGVVNRTEAVAFFLRGGGGGGRSPPA